MREARLHYSLCMANIAIHFCHTGAIVFDVCGHARQGMKGATIVGSCLL